MSYYGNTTQPTSATYPYGSYQAQYPYQAGAAAYHPWQYHHYYQVPRPGQTTPTTLTPRPAATPGTATTTATPTTQRTTSFQPYNPPTATTSYARDTTSTASTGASGRGGKRQSNMKGLFTKERMHLPFYAIPENMFISFQSKISCTALGTTATQPMTLLMLWKRYSLNTSPMSYVDFSLYSQHLTHPPQCLAASGPSRRARLSVEDLRKVLSRPADAKKLARMEELIFMQEDIKRARAQFEESDNPKGF